jgi:hypothetical protein
VSDDDMLSDDLDDNFLDDDDDDYLVDDEDIELDIRGEKNSSEIFLNSFCSKFILILFFGLAPIKE